MGRVAKYKKIKSVDPFAKNGSSWKSDVGDCTTLRRVKRRSKTALKLKEQKMRKRNRKGGEGGGSNGFGSDDGFDLPPSGKDEWDWSDMVGSVKSQPHKKGELNELNTTPMPTVIPSKGAAHKVVALDKKKQQRSKKTAIPPKANIKKSLEVGDKITSRTSTREIIEAYSRPNSSKRLSENGAADSESGITNKAKKKKAFLDSKKNKKRRKQVEQELDDEEYAAQQKALRSLHSSQSSPDTEKTHLVKQSNYSETLRTRTVIDSQVERPPIFSSLPRGATKLKKAAVSVEGRNGQSDKQRIKKEQQQMELMRQRVMQSYAKLRESRRIA